MEIMKTMYRVQLIIIVNEPQNSSPEIIWKHLWKFTETQNALLDSSFFHMPTEMILRIFELLSHRDRKNVSLVCRYFKMVVEQDNVWKIKCTSKLYSSSNYFKCKIESKKLHSKPYKQISFNRSDEKISIYENTLGISTISSDFWLSSTSKFIAPICKSELNSFNL